MVNATALGYLLGTRRFPLVRSTQGVFAAMEQQSFFAEMTLVNAISL